jgi:ribonucleotide reductase beta subunit family protein with ferritin-like domain
MSPCVLIIGFFFYALQFAITMYSKFREEITNPLGQINLIDDDHGITFELFWNLCFLLKEDLKKEKFTTCCF